MVKEDDDIVKETIALESMQSSGGDSSSSRSTSSQDLIEQQGTTTTSLNLMVGREFEEWDQAFLSKYDSKDMDTVVTETLNSSSSSSSSTSSDSNLGMTTTATISSEENLDRRFVNELDDLMVRQEFSEWDEAFKKQLNNDV